MGVIDHLKWRYATKKYSDKTVDSADLDKIIESIVLAPTSLGLQAFEILVLDRQNVLREQLLSACSNQPQITEASHLIIFNAWKSVSDQDILDYMLRISNLRGTPIENLEGFKSNIHKFVGGMSNHELFAWSSMQTYIALGMAMTAAAELKIDTTPMEGFNRNKVDEIVNLDNENLSCAVILAVGYRDADRDFLANLPKVRKSKSDMVKFG